MADFFDFAQYANRQDIYGMSLTELKNCLRQTREHIDELDELEPEDIDSEEYELWADAHEQLEDLADEIQDLLDEA